MTKESMMLAALAIAPAAHAQLLTVSCDNDNGQITAWADSELRSFLGDDYNLVSFFDLRLVGNVSNLAVTPSFQSPIFGFVADDATGRVQGQADNPPLGSYVSQSFMVLATYDGFVRAIEVNGQFDGARNSGGLFPEAFNYQNADGSPGTIGFTVLCIPAPGSAAVLGFAGLAAVRRR